MSTPITERYESFENAVEEVAEKVVGRCSPCGMPSWVSDRIKQLRTERDVAKRKCLLSKSKQSREIWRKLDSSLNESYKADEIARLNKQMEELQLADSKGDYSPTWKIIHDLSGKDQNPKVKVKMRDGAPPKSDKDLLAEWQEYFISLLNNVNGQAHILRRVLEGFRDYQLSLVVTFIDFKKAFDSINRKVMFAVLRHYGIPEAVVNAISVLHKNSKSVVMVDRGLSDPFDVTTGVLQGDVLAPFLFVVLVDYLLKKATSQLDSGVVTHPRRSRRHPAKSLNDLDFADDIALLEFSISRAQAQLTKTAEAAADLGLVISALKTEYMTVNCNPQPALQVYGDPINHVSDFRYLGSMVASGSSDLKRRKSLAWCAFWKLEQLLKSPHISITTKVKLFNTTCVTILLYGCESWVISQDMENKINAFATSCY